MAGDEKPKGSGMAADAVDVRGAGGPLHLVRDLLDNQLVDNRHDPMGRADGVVLAVEEGRQPRVAFVESGITVSTGRVSRRLGHWVRAAARRWGLRHGEPTRVAWSKVKKVGIDIEVDLEADRTNALAWEHWLRDHVVRYVPSLKPRNKDKHGEEKHDEGSDKGQEE